MAVKNNRHSCSVIGLFFFALSACLFSPAPLAARDNPSSNNIERLIKDLTAKTQSTKSILPVFSPRIIAKFYEQRNYQPAWSSGDNARILRHAIADAPSHGLRQKDFHPELLGLVPDQRIPVKPAAERDILLTDALLSLLYQLYFGKVSPKKIDSDWNITGPERNENGLKLVSQALDTQTLGDLFKEVNPPGVTYQKLRQALRLYRGHAKRGGWEPIPPGPLLKPNMEDPRLTAIRKRLDVTGEYTWDEETENPIYDEALVAAVKGFQRKHGLDVDGFIGPATISAMNVPVSKRIDQIRVNLERARWIVRPLINEKDIVAVNIAGFYLLVRLDGKFVHWTDVITGKTYHKTPVFADEITYIEFNPTWTIPRSIIKKEILPQANLDPTYFYRKAYQLIDAKGKKANPDNVNWSTVTARNFPYDVVQPPGPNNALGLVKFMFPNKHNVYLHDTPGRSLFSKTGRTFSHGCVRVKDPMKLAEIILGNRNDISRKKIDEILATGERTRINLKKPLKVAILYWTVDPVWQGGIRFYKDVYNRDNKVLKALDAPFKPKLN